MNANDERGEERMNEYKFTPKTKRMRNQFGVAVSEGATMEEAIAAFARRHGMTVSDVTHYFAVERS